MNAIEPTRQLRRELEAGNKKWRETLKPIPFEEWGWNMRHSENAPIEAWRSRNFLLQVFSEPNGIERLSICRTSHNGERWQENISWDELQRLKSECGRGGKDAVEVYPPDDDVVNVANMRHIWILNERLPFVWRKP